MNSVVFGALAVVTCLLVATGEATLPGVPGVSVDDTVRAVGDTLLKSAAAPRYGCPLCDSSVYSYCSNKLFHDACCCHGGFGCPPTNCNYLHANSCYEHQLIQSCCCNNPYR